jgi:amino acid adenylation domain-containing protein
MKELTIQVKIEESFVKFSDNIAIERGFDILTYYELSKRIDCVADFILEKKIKKGARICLFLENRMELITVMLGVLKAGCIFVPIDTTYPEERIKVLFDEIDPEFVFYDNTKIQFIFQCDHECISDAFYQDCDTRSYQIEADTRPEDPIYAFFTSGTTGKPKAVIGKNKSLLHFILWEIDMLGLVEPCNISQLTTPCHDPILRDILVALFTGGKICVPKLEENYLETNHLISWIQMSEINLIHCTPSVFRLLNWRGLQKENFPDLKYVFMAGEEIRPSDLKSWYDVFGDRIQLVNLYGATETTMVKTYYKIHKEDVLKNHIPVGVPMKGSRVILLNQSMNICEPGEVGEIYIRTAYGTYGYYNQPQLNAEKFIRNPFSDNHNDLIYKSGDLGRILEDGNLEFLGREDRQIKIRGNRIETGEIENAITSIPEIDQTYVIVKQGVNDENYLAAYLVISDTLKHKKIDIPSFMREELSKSLMDYMIPREYKVMDKMPLTSSGKTDYKQLPAIQESEEDQYEEPVGMKEKKIVEIWSGILEKKRISRSDNVFRLGAHSLNIMMFITKVNEEFGIEVPLSMIFEKPTIKEMAEYITNVGTSSVFEIEVSAEREYYPASYAQERIYAQNVFNNQDISYNMTDVLVFDGNLDIAKVNRIMNELIDRHESLRSSFEIMNGNLVQRIHQNLNFEITMLEEIEACPMEDEVHDRIDQFVQPFDLSKVPLFRVGLAKVKGIAKYIMMIDMHHIISDAYSVEIIQEEFLKRYNGVELTRKQLHYRDYAIWQKQFIESDTADQYRDYWMNELSGPISRVKLTEDSSIVTDNKCSTMRFCVETEQYKVIQEFVMGENLTVNMYLCAVFNLLLSKYSGNEEVTIGCTIDGRVKQELDHVVGTFINILPLRTYQEHTKSIFQYLQETKKKTLKMLENQYYPYEMLLHDLKFDSKKGTQNLFDICFNVLPPSNKVMLETQDVKILGFDYDIALCRFDMAVNVFEYKDYVEFKVEYNASLFDDPFLLKLKENYLDLLEKLRQDTSASIGTISLKNGLNHTKQKTEDEEYEFNFD